MRQRTGRKLLSVLLALALVTGLVPGMGLTARADGNVPYQEASWNSTEKKVEYTSKTADATAVTAGSTAWNAGWYVVNSNVTVNSRITVTGAVNLILSDNTTLIAKEGITVAEGNTLNIYAQSGGNGILRAGAESGGGRDRSCAAESAGIGGGYGQKGGVVSIHGGTVIAKGGEGDVGAGAGIGGGTSGAGGTLTVYGGRVTADGAFGDGAGAGIGGGKGSGSNTGGIVTIYGGSVTATGGLNGGAGIGGGCDGYGGGDGGTVTIHGGTVTAYGGGEGESYGMGIGAGKEGSSNGTLTVATTHAAYSHTEEITDANKTGLTPVQGTGAAFADTALNRKQYMLVESNAAAALDPVSYKTASVNETTHSVTFTDASCEDYTAVTASTTAFADGKWYVVNANVTNENRITVTGTANLILADGKTLTASKGITVSSGNTLNIYAQSDGTGALVADASSVDVENDRAAGIGGYCIYNGNYSFDKTSGNAGTVTIHGGIVTAKGGPSCAGIGGGIYADGGAVTIYGGTVRTQGGTRNEASDSPGKGIGGSGYNNGTLTVAATHAVYSHTEEITGANKDGVEAAQGTGATSAITRNQYMLVEPGTVYPVWVGGVRPTTTTMTDVFGDGKVSYTPATTGENPTPATLTLDNYTYTGTGYMDAAIYAKEALTIVLKGTNSVTHDCPADRNNSYGVRLDGKVNAGEEFRITGTGTLTATGGNSKNSTYGIAVSYNDFIIDKGVTVHAVGGSTPIEDGFSYGVDAYNMTVDGTLEANGGNSRISYGLVVYPNQSLTVGSGGSVTATGGTAEFMSAGLYASSTLTVNGQIEATGGASENRSLGIWSEYFGDKLNLVIGGTLTAKGNHFALADYKDSVIAGNACTVPTSCIATESVNFDGSASTTAAAGSKLATTDKYVKIERIPHTHDFTYSATGATITATCGNHDDCPLASGNYQATLTIAAPLHTNVGDEKIAEATITDANSIRGDALVRYYAATKNGTTYTKTGDALGSAPTGAGNYVAEITVGGKTAFVGYTISKTAQDAPTGFTSTPAATPYAEGSINDGPISKTNLQLKVPGSTDWVAVDSFPISGKPGIYQFKYKETDELAESPVTSVLLEATNELREVKITSDKTNANLYKSGETNTLTAVTNSNVDGLTLEFAWFREGVTEAVGTGNTYALQAADVGKKLTVVVTDKTTGAPTNPAPTVSTATPVIVTVAPTTYQITGNVKVPTADGATTYNNVANANVELRQGNTVFATDKTVSEGNYTFSAVPNGEYNIVVTDASGTTKTEYVKVENGNQTINVTMPFYKVSSKVVVSGETPAAVVAGLDTAVVDSLTNDEKASGVTTTMTMEIESSNDLTAKAESDLTDEQKQVKTEQQKIKEKNTGAGASANLDFLDMSVYKRTQKTGESAQVEDVHNLTKVLEILLPYTTANRSFNIFRYHGTAATKFTRLTTRPTGIFTDGEFFVGDGFIAIYASGFSTYAIGYSASSSSGPAPAPAPTTTPTYSTGGGSSDSDDYLNTVVKTNNGTVSVNRGTSSSGEKVTITIKPDTGYTVDTVTVSGSGSRNVAVTKVTDTTYTYIQPGTDVKINVTFRATSGTAWADCPKDNSCPLSAFSDTDAQAWYHDGVHWALNNGVMNGVGGDRFDPGGETSRAMVVTMLWRLEGSPAYVGKNEFEDVKSEDWYAQAVRWASAEGIVTGYEQDGVKVFNPNGAVTREQLATMLYRYAQHKGQGFTGLWSFPLDYPDTANVSEWAYEAMCWMTMNGVINGMDGKLAPAASATRAQVASMFMRYCTSAAK